MPIKEPPHHPSTTMDDDGDNRNIDNSSDVLMSVAEVTRFLGYKDDHFVLNLLKSGELKGHRVGKRWLIWRSKLIAYINRH